MLSNQEHEMRHPGKPIHYDGYSHCRECRYARDKIYRLTHPENRTIKALRSAITAYHATEPISSRYDGRRGNKLGITWKIAAENLEQDIGKHPGKGWSLDHIIPESIGTVEGNLRWADWKTQAKNKRAHQVPRYEHERVVSRFIKRNAFLENEVKNLKKHVDKYVNIWQKTSDQELESLMQSWERWKSVALLEPKLSQNITKLEVRLNREYPNKEKIRKILESANIQTS